MKWPRAVAVAVAAAVAAAVAVAAGAASWPTSFGNRSCDLPYGKRDNKTTGQSSRRTDRRRTDVAGQLH